MSSVGIRQTPVQSNPIQSKIDSLKAEINKLENKEPVKASTLQADKISIGTNVKPGIGTGAAGLLAGGVAGGLLGVGGTAIYGKLAGEAGFGLAMTKVIIGGVGVVAGGVAGAVVTQKTGDPGKGAMIGAGVGALTGGIAMGLSTGTLQGVAVGVVTGAIAGAGSGVISSFITAKE